MLKRDPTITYDHMHEESTIKGKYFKRTSIGKNHIALFFAEEMFILGLLSALIYLVFV